MKSRIHDNSTDFLCSYDYRGRGEGVSYPLHTRRTGPGEVPRSNVPSLSMKTHSQMFLILRRLYLFFGILRTIYPACCHGAKKTDLVLHFSLDIISGTKWNVTNHPQMSEVEEVDDLITEVQLSVVALTLCSDEIRSALSHFDLVATNKRRKCRHSY